MALADVRRFVNGRLQALQASQAPESQGPVDGGAEQVPRVPSLQELVASRPFLAISVGNCPQCEELAAALAARGVPGAAFEKWEDRGDPAYPALKAALAAHAGEAFSFPQVFAEGVYQGGWKEVVDKADRGAYDELFAREFDAEPQTVQRWVEQKPVLVFSLPNCPQCDVLYEDLRTRGVPVAEVFVKLDKAGPEYPSLKAQLAKLIGRDKFTFPQTFVQAVYQGSFEEVLAKAAAGGFAGAFEEAFGLAPAAKSAASPAAAEEPLSYDDDF